MSVTMTKLVCEKCGIEFTVESYRALRGTRFCSRKCAQKVVSKGRKLKGSRYGIPFASGYNDEAKLYRRANWLSKYNLTIDEFDNMLDMQQNVCAICLGEFGKKGPCIDHNHETGKVRGILCVFCNSFIGRINEKPYAALGMYGYLTTR